MTFHLLHAEENEKYPIPPLALRIPSLSSGDLIFLLDFLQVPSLLVEDWDEALGLKAEWNNGVCFYKITTAGQLISKMPDGSVAVMGTDDLPKLVNSYIATFVTKTMLERPELKLKTDN